jgi:allophanate hydrolase
VAVALGQVSFALGTDTAGSGRVPAAFNNIVGLKPSCGMISAAGVVPACQSLDCVSIFALNCEDASTILQNAEAFDPDDPYSRHREELPPRRGIDPSKPRVGVPREDPLEFFGDDEAKSLYQAAIERIKSIGGTVSEIDYQPFLDTAALLYAGPWLAERYLVVKDLIERDPSVLFPVTRSILARGAGISAAEAFAGLHELRALRHKAYAQLATVDLLLLPSSGTIYTIEQVNAEPIQLNTNLGYYTNFVNLLDLTALAVPCGFKRSAGVPLGVTLIGHAGTEHALLEMGSEMHRALGIGPGVAQQPLPPTQEPFSGSSMTTTIQVAVLGAHLSGMPLNHQMTERGAKLVRATRTAPIYRFYALPNTTPPKPGMVRVIDEPGYKIEVEVWEMPIEA